MPVDDVALVAADTSRTRAYICALRRNGLLPNYVLVLGGAPNELLPGQSGNSTDHDGLLLDDKVEDGSWSEIDFDPTIALVQLLEDARLTYEVAPVNNVNDHRVEEMISRRPESVFIYSGFGGTILGKRLLETGKRFLHVHGGYLPLFRGSTTNYYSLIIENSVGASSIFLTEDIDSGPILYRQRFKLPIGRIHIDHKYDSAARAKVLVSTIMNYVESGEWKIEKNDDLEGETYFIIHPVLKHISILGDNLGRLFDSNMDNFR